MKATPKTIFGAQIRAGRVLLRWSVADLAGRFTVLKQ
jgi:hypothetical protein